MGVDVRRHEYLPRYSAVAGYAAMALAIAVGFAGFMVADVQPALARIDADDPPTWPNMAPQVRYFFIPVVAGAVVVAAVGGEPTFDAN